MDRLPIKSYRIKSVGYDPKKRDLEIEFQNGEIYQYLNVPGKVYHAFAESETSNKYDQYLERNIQFVFPFCKVSDKSQESG